MVDVKFLGCFGQFLSGLDSLDRVKFVTSMELISYAISIKVTSRKLGLFSGLVQATQAYRQQKKGQTRLALASLEKKNKR
jgi:hypothetical protein